MAITKVESKASSVKVYDETGQCTAEMPGRRVEVLGFTSDFFVTFEGAWIRTYDQDCNRIASMNGSDVTFRSISTDTFTTDDDGWLKTYDRRCKKISEHAK